MKRTRNESPGPGEDSLVRVGPLRVLVVDDQRDEVLTLTALLRGEGYEVRGAHNGYAALVLVQEFDPDVVLLDINMPGMSGYDVARELRSRAGRKRLLLIAVTAADQLSDKALAKMIGFNHHLSKPYYADALLTLLSELTLQRK